MVKSVFDSNWVLRLRCIRESETEPVLPLRDIQRSVNRLRQSLLRTIHHRIFILQYPSVDLLHTHLHKLPGVSSSFPFLSVLVLMQIVLKSL